MKRAQTREATIQVRTAGAEVRARRVGLELTQEEAAAQLKMDRGRLSAIENNYPSIRVTTAEARRFRDVLGVPLEVWP